jgi:putative transposase
MPRALRIQAEDAVYHLTGQGNSGGPLFLDDADRRRYLLLLGMAVDRYGWHCYGFCLMTTHYHLHVMTPEPNLARGMQWLNGVYAQCFNKRHAHEGHVLRGRYKSTLVEREGHFLEVVRYVALNPVRAGICASPRDWPWSSYPALIRIARAPRFLELFGTPEKAARKRLVSFVEGP